MEIIIALVQALLLVLLAPLVSGSARWLRAKMHTRKGPSILQDYYDIAKLFRRQDVHPKDSSFVHKLMPPLFMGVLLVLAMGIPMITMASPIAWLGDIILVLYLLALPRFFFSLSAIDSSDAYAGIGGVRELIIGVLAFFAACYIELGKLPYDLAEAEQELQEGPLSEYSGPSLAMGKMALSMKQIIVASWFIAIFVPWGAATELTIPALACGLAAWLVKMLVFFFICGVFENIVSRVRYKLVGRQTWAVVALALFGFVFCVLRL